MISKGDAAKMWTAGDDDAWLKAEGVIDTAIKKGGRVVVDLSSIKLNDRVKARINSAYGDGGWKLAWTTGDQRDPGPFIELI